MSQEVSPVPPAAPSGTEPRGADRRTVAAASALVAGAIGLSAFLLFALELLVGRLILPAFGGAPAAWATVLVFFQAVLLVGYLYGHLVVSRLSVVAGAVLHAVVVLVAAVSLVAWPADLATLRDPALGPVFDLLRVLTLALGLPSFLLTTTTPLLSSWYARIRGAREGDDPFWLYAVSNGASFAALVAYPFVVERVWGLGAQRAAWIAGYFVLSVALVVAAALTTLRGRRRAPGDPLGAAPGAGVDPDPAGGAPEVDPATGPGAGAGWEAPAPGAITWRRRAAWVLIAAIPSALLSAISNLIATDLVAAPMIWMGPLAIYLLSFVVAFSRRGRRIVPWALALTPVAVTLLWVPLGSVGMWPAAPLIVLALVAYAVVATGLNGVLALDRPEARYLTDFYLWLAVGGVLGGSFVGVVAPIVFPDIWEYPILLVLTLVAIVWGVPAGQAAGAAAARVAGSPAHGTPAAPGSGSGPGGSPGRRRHRFPLDFGPFVAGAPRRLVPYGIAAAAITLAIVPLGGLTAEAVVRWLAVGALVLVVGGIPRFFVAATAVLLVVVTLVIPGPALFQGRSFFGVTRVVEPGGPWRVLMNGTTVHGLQSTDTALRRVPTAYYVEPGPAGDFFGAMRAASGPRPLDIGVVGLGSGGLAAYERAGDSMTFYEIDPVVIRVASDPGLFTFLSDAPERPRIVEGDARLTLAQVADASHDLLVVDAFSSDTPPTHLLTLEAIRDAMRTVKPGGLLVLHLSNRYYRLAPAVAGAASALGLTALERDYSPTDADAQRLHASPSIWVAVGRTPADLDGLRARGWVEPDVTDPLTDDQPDLLRLMRPLW